jgi:hypothetical protein
MGMGLTSIRYWTVAYHLAEVSRIDSGWDSVDPDDNRWTDDRSIPVDEKGYPISLEDDQSARTAVFLHNDGEYETGAYLLTWDGTGTLGLDTNGVSSVVEEGAGDRKDHRRVINVQETSDIGMLLFVHETDPEGTGDNIRNVDLWKPGFWEDDRGDRTSRYHSHLKNNVEPFDGPIRFMDWGQTNNSPEQHWRDRIEPGEAHYGGDRGVPYERMIDLCNEVGMEPWICVPHMATDNYIQQLAELVYERLNPGLRVWVEYTNEYWNSIFDQWEWIQEQSQDSDLNHPQWYADRAVAVFRTFEEAFGSTERLVRVVGGQAANPWQLEQALGRAGEYADAGAIAYYFTHTETEEHIANNHDTITIEEAFDLIHDDIVSQRDGSWTEHKGICDDHDVPLISYEGQQHLVPSQYDDEDAVFKTFLEINRHDRMYDEYQFALDAWRNDVGAGTLMPFTDSGKPSVHGYWGHKEVGRLPMDDKRAIKYRAIHDWLRDNPP